MIYFEFISVRMKLLLKNVKTNQKRVIEYLFAVTVTLKLHLREFTTE